MATTMSKFDAVQLFSVKGLVAVVTGAGSGLGEAMAHALDVNGAAKVFILGRRETKLKEVAAKAVRTSSRISPQVLRLAGSWSQEAIKDPLCEEYIGTRSLRRYQANGSLIPVRCDVSSKESLQAAVSTIEKQTGFINLLVASAGYLGEVTNLAPRAAEQTLGELQKELWNIQTYEDASQVVGTNIAGSYFTFLAFLSLLGAGNKHPDSVGNKGLLQSQFITITSAAAFRRIESPSYLYNASKAALNHLTKSLSTEYARQASAPTPSPLAVLSQK
jgi:NAD(P)-dependent dehydrogenase (short-subunit alcohol dehydrogenase family)